MIISTFALKMLFQILKKKYTNLRFAFEIESKI